MLSGAFCPWGSKKKKLSPLFLGCFPPFPSRDSQGRPAMEVERCGGGGSTWWRRKWCWTDDEAGGAGWMVAYVETSARMTTTLGKRRVRMGRGLAKGCDGVAVGDEIGSSVVGERSKKLMVGEREVGGSGLSYARK